VSERASRRAHNEGVFRAANEQLRATRDELGFPPVERTPFLCECGEPACVAPIMLSLGEYETVRNKPNRFALLPGHDDPEEETVVSDGAAVCDRFAVVEKRPELDAA
jgi:hypothetical protein